VGVTLVGEKHNWWGLR